jgi:two-component system response regulator HydG
VQKALDKHALVAENRELRAQLAAATSQADRRQLAGHARVARDGQAGGELVGDGAAARRERHRQGAVRPLHPPAQRPGVASAGPDQLRGAAGVDPRERAVRPREGRVHRRDAQREGRFVEANTGTLFLDEIGEIPLHIQVKLLRAAAGGGDRAGRRAPDQGRLPPDLRDQPRPVSEEVKAGRFREDLFYRINVIPIRVPPLRDRLEDVPLLADHFLRIYAHKHGKRVSGFTEAALHRMGNYGWPGNVREFENAVERAVVLCRGELVDELDLPPELRDPQAGHGRQITFSVGTPLEEVERRMISETLKFTRGDKRLAADLLGIATRTIYRKLEAGHPEPTQTPAPAAAGASAADDEILH